MESEERRKVAVDLMTGLLRKGWILPQHSSDMANDLDEIISQSEPLSKAIEDARKYRDEKPQWNAEEHQRRFGRFRSVEEILER